MQSPSCPQMPSAAPQLPRRRQQPRGVPTHQQPQGPTRPPRQQPHSVHRDRRANQSNVSAPPAYRAADVECTTSEVKRRRARLVLGWGGRPGRPQGAASFAFGLVAALTATAGRANVQQRRVCHCTNNRRTAERANTPTLRALPAGNKGCGADEDQHEEHPPWGSNPRPQG